MPKAATLRRRPKPRAAARAPKGTAGANAPKAVWHFGPGSADGHAKMKELLGGKGANLAEMCRLGLPVPPGFTIATSVCERYTKNGGKVPADVSAAVRAAMT